MSLPRDDLDLIDALVWAGCLSRAAAKEVAATAEPGRVATYISEKGLAPAIQPPQVIVRALVYAEKWAEFEAGVKALAASEAERRGANVKTMRAEVYFPLAQGDKPETD